MSAGVPDFNETYHATSSMKIRDLKHVKIKTI